MKCSAKETAQFLQFQSFLDVEEEEKKGILHLSQTRWLSLATVVSRTVELWEIQQTFRLPVKIVAAQQILECLTDPIVKLFYLFLQ